MVLKFRKIIQQFSLIFEKKKQHKRPGVLACHVDYFLWGGSNESENNVTNKHGKLSVLEMECMEKMLYFLM